MSCYKESDIEMKNIINVFEVVESSTKFICNEFSRILMNIGIIYRYASDTWIRLRL